MNDPTPPQSSQSTGGTGVVIKIVQSSTKLDGIVENVLLHHTNIPRPPLSL